MGMLDYFEEQEQSVIPWGKKNIKDPVNNVTEISYVALEAISGIFFQDGKSVEKYVSERLIAEVDAIYLTDPERLGTVTVKDFDKIVFDGREFTIVNPDNINLIDEIITLYLREKK